MFTLSTHIILTKSMHYKLERSSSRGESREEHKGEKLFTFVAFYFYCCSFTKVGSFSQVFFCVPLPIIIALHTLLDTAAISIRLV